MTPPVHESGLNSRQPAQYAVDLPQARPDPGTPMGNFHLSPPDSMDKPVHGDVVEWSKARGTCSR